MRYMDNCYLFFDFRLNSFLSVNNYHHIFVYHTCIKMFPSNRCRITFFFYYLVCEAIGTAPTPGLFCQPRGIVKMIVERSRWNVDWRGTPNFSDKPCPSATFVQHKIPHDQTRVGTGAAGVEAGD
jgi:hypothetical protein